MGHELADLIETLNVRFVLPGSYLMVHTNFRD